MGEPLRVGIIGAGKISAQYGGMIPKYSNLRVTSVADRVLDALESLLRSAETGRVEALTTTAARPRGVPLSDGPVA